MSNQLPLTWRSYYHASIYNTRQVPMPPTATTDSALAASSLSSSTSSASSYSFFSTSSPPSSSSSSLSLSLSFAQSSTTSAANLPIPQPSISTFGSSLSASSASSSSYPPPSQSLDPSFFNPPTSNSSSFALRRHSDDSSAEIERKRLAVDRLQASFHSNNYQYHHHHPAISPTYQFWMSRQGRYPTSALQVQRHYIDELPVEIQLQILQCCCENGQGLGTLLNCCLLSKYWYRLSIPQLWQAPWMVYYGSWVKCSETLRMAFEREEARWLDAAQDHVPVYEQQQQHHHEQEQQERDQTDLQHGLYRLAVALGQLESGHNQFIGQERSEVKRMDHHTPEFSSNNSTNSGQELCRHQPSQQDQVVLQQQAGRQQDKGGRNDDTSDRRTKDKSSLALPDIMISCQPHFGETTDTLAAAADTASAVASSSTTTGVLSLDDCDLGENKAILHPRQYMPNGSRKTLEHAQVMRSESHSDSRHHGQQQHGQQPSPLLECNYGTFVRLLDFTELYYILSDLFLANFVHFTPRLTDIVINSPKQFSDASLATLAQQCPQLERLELSGCTRITDKAMVQLLLLNGDHWNKTDSFSGHERHDSDLVNCVPSGHIGHQNDDGARLRLRKLTLSNGTRLGDLTLSVIGSGQLCKTLTHLDVSNASLLFSMSNPGLLSIPLYCTRLLHVNLSYCQDLHDNVLGAFTDLISLNISFCPQITDLGLIAMAENSANSLQELSMTGCVLISDHGLEVLGYQCHKLESVSMEDHGYGAGKVTEECLAKFRWGADMVSRRRLLGWKNNPRIF